MRNLERGSESDSWMCTRNGLTLFTGDVMGDTVRKLKKSKARLNQAKVMIEQLQEKVVKLEAQLAAKPAPKVVAPKVAPVAKKVVKKVAAKKVAKKVVKK